MTRLTPSQQHTMIDRPHLAHLFALALRLGVRESIDRPALAWMELEREAVRMGEESRDIDVEQRTLDALEMAYETAILAELDRETREDVA